MMDSFAVQNLVFLSHAVPMQFELDDYYKQHMSERWNYFRFTIAILFTIVFILQFWRQQKYQSLSLERADI